MITVMLIFIKKWIEKDCPYLAKHNNQLIMPLPQEYSQTIIKNTPVSNSFKTNNPSQVSIVMSAFAISMLTIHKCQGFALKKVTLSLIKGETKASKITFAHLFAALSRCKSSVDVRALLLNEQNISCLKYLTTKNPSKYYVNFRKRFDPEK